MFNDEYARKAISTDANYVQEIEELVMCCLVPPAHRLGVYFKCSLLQNKTAYVIQGIQGMEI